MMKITYRFIAKKKSGPRYSNTLKDVQDVKLERNQISESCNIKPNFDDLDKVLFQIDSAPIGTQFSVKPIV